MDSVIFRLFLALLLIALGLLAYAAFSRLVIYRLQRKPLRLNNARPGVPTILYFTSPTCVPCRTLQAPAIHRVVATLGEALQVVKVDAQAQPELADQWGVLSVPATFILDRAGKPRFFNLGLARAEQLEQQLRQIL